MGTVRIIVLILLIATAFVAVMIRRPVPEVASKNAAVISASAPAESVVATQPPLLKTNEAPVAVESPVQSIEDRGDAMLFEVEALGNTPFDQEIVTPFD